MTGYDLAQERERDRLQRERYAAAFPGWKQHSIPRCPRVVAGRRCYVGDGRNVPKCICYRYHHRIFDHTRLWKTPEGFRVLTTEPYHVTLDDLVSFREECLALGLEVQVFGYSPYYPGATLTLMIHRGNQEVRHCLESQPVPAGPMVMAGRHHHITAAAFRRQVAAVLDSLTPCSCTPPCETCECQEDRHEP